MTQELDVYSNMLLTLLRRAGYDQLIDDKVYNYKGLWRNRPSVETMNIGNMVLIEDWPFYIGSVWKRAALPYIFPVAGIQTCALNGVDVYSIDNGINQDIFETYIPSDMFIPGVNLHFDFRGHKFTNTIGATLKFYCSNDDEDIVELMQYIMAPTDYKFIEGIMVKVGESEDDLSWILTATKVDDDELTTPYPDSVVIPKPTDRGSNLRFYMQFQSNTVGEVFVLKNYSCTYSSV